MSQGCPSGRTRTGNTGGFDEQLVERARPVSITNRVTEIGCTAASAVLDWAA